MKGSKTGNKIQRKTKRGDRSIQHVNETKGKQQ